MQLKLSLKTPFILLLTGLLFWGGLSYSQTPENEAGETAVPAEASAPAPEGAPQEDHDTKDLEKLLKRYNTDQEKILEDTSKLHNIVEEAATSEMKESDLEEIRNKGLVQKAKDASVSRANSESERKEKQKLIAQAKYSESVRQALEPLQKLSEEELLKRLKEGSKDSPMRPYMERYPKVTLYSVRLIKDKDSIPSIMRILEDRDRLVTFISVMLFTVIFGFILKRIMHREGRSFLKACAFFLTRVLILLCIRIGVIYYFYSNELTPAAKVFKQTFFT